MSATIPLNPALATKKFYIRTACFIGSYLLVNAAVLTQAFDDIRPRGAVGLALSIAAPVIGHIWSFLAWMRDSDEFVRTVAAKRFVVAAGLTMAIASAWGSMELYASARHISAAFLYPLFWVLIAMVAPFIRSSHL